MKNLFNIKTIFALAICASLFFTACKKKNPVQELNQEEFSKVEFIFTEGTVAVNSTLFTATANVAAKKITFNADGTSDQKIPVQLVKGKKYQLQLNFYDNKGENVNHEFLDEALEHQFFFIPSTTGMGALSYNYSDANVGITGVFNILAENKLFDLTVNLRHGIDKTGNKTYSWNDPNYLKYGETDFQTELKIQTVAQ